MIRRHHFYVLVALLIALGVAAHFAGLTEFLSSQSIIAKREALLDAAGAHPILAPLVFMATYVAVAVLALPVAAVLSLLGGFLFGRWLGAGLVLVSATTGAMIIFMLARSAIGESLRRRAGPLYDKVAKNMRANAFGYLLFLRLVPLFPFFLVNLVAALFDIKARTFVLATFLGIAPATLIYVNVGREIGTVSNLHDLLSPGVLIALTGLGLLALTPAVYQQWVRNRSTPITKA